VFGNAVADLTHLVAELVENAVHFSPPEASVIIRTRPYLRIPGAHVLTVEDWGVGMRPEDMAEANELLAAPREVDLSVSQRLGLQVVARLAQRHGIQVSLSATPGCGVTAAVVLRPSLFADPDAGPEEAFGGDGAVPAELVPALAGSPAATDHPAPAAPPGWAPAERWGDHDGPAGGDAGRFAGDGHEAERSASHGPAGDGHRAGQPAATEAAAEAAGNGHGDGDAYGHGDGRAAGDGGAVPAGGGNDWSGWWDPAPAHLQDGQPLSPIAARPPLSERVQAASMRQRPTASPAPQRPPASSAPQRSPASAVPQRPPSTPRPQGPTGTPRPQGPTGTPKPQGPTGTPDPQAPMPGPPNREGSRAASDVEPVVHTPTPPPDGPLLSRRVPQAHLAPELRCHGQAQGPAAARHDAPMPDAAEARAALSRYQASRQAARAMVDEGGVNPGSPGPEGPASDGGWA
jgi:Histidine kinase-, DNA gyrase B-, and HSP90-like ATPase